MTKCADLSYIILVMCRGSGKSTLAVQWEALYPDHYVRVNQDALGDRRKCEALTSAALLQVSHSNKDFVLSFETSNSLCAGKVSYNR